MKSEIETGSGAGHPKPGNPCRPPGRTRGTIDQIQADAGPEILTRSATSIPMPKGETAPQADGQMVFGRKY